MNNKKLTLYYAICQYVPDPAVDRKGVNIGIVYHIPQQKLSRFYHIKTKKKLLAYDHKCNLNFIDIMYASLSEVFDNYNNQSKGEADDYFPNISENTFLSSRTKYYVNTFRFSPVHSVTVTLANLDDNITMLKKAFLA